MTDSLIEKPTYDGALLAIDARNTATRLGLFFDEPTNPFATWSISTPSSLTVDEAKRELHSFFEMVRGGHRDGARRRREAKGHRVLPLSPPPSWHRSFPR